jgi:hypothetical protein
MSLWKETKQRRQFADRLLVLSASRTFGPGRPLPERRESRRSAPPCRRSERTRFDFSDALFDKNGAEAQVRHVHTISGGGYGDPGPAPLAQKRGDGRKHAERR